ATIRSGLPTRSCQMRWKRPDIPARGQDSGMGFPAIYGPASKESAYPEGRTPKSAHAASAMRERTLRLKRCDAPATKRRPQRLSMGAPHLLLAPETVANAAVRRMGPRVMVARKAIALGSRD